MFDRLKNILRASEQKVSRTTQLIAFQSAGRARWTPRDYAALAREGYVLLYTIKRVGGGVQDFDAIKLLKFSGA